MTAVDSVQRSIPQRDEGFQWKKAAALTGKVLVVALLVAALAAAAYFTAGAAIALFAQGASLYGGLASLGALSFGGAALSVPVLAGAHKMYRVTKENLKDIVRFAKFIVALAAIGFLAFLYGRYGRQVF
jgi:hypothetical protein